MEHNPDLKSSARQDESALLWAFLEEEAEACAVVSSRMEFVYLNRLARHLVPKEWFAKRCFETFPVTNERCAFFCPTITAVHEAREIVYCRESLRLAGGESLELDVAVIPLEGKSLDEAAALLLLRKQLDRASLHKLAEEATALRNKLRSHSG
jgi:hypothetical protein